MSHYHTGTMTRRSWGLSGVHPERIFRDQSSGKTELKMVMIFVYPSEAWIVGYSLTLRVPPGLAFITLSF